MTAAPPEPVTCRRCENLLLPAAASADDPGMLVCRDAEPRSSRQRLPNRRECFTETIALGNAVYGASVGFDEEGTPREIFLSGAKTGSDMEAVLGDSSILISIMLQSGIPAERLAVSMSRIPGEATDRAAGRASVLGLALDLLAGYEAEEWR